MEIQHVLRALLDEVTRRYAKGTSYSSSLGYDSEAREVKIITSGESLSPSLNKDEASIAARGRLKVKYESYLSSEGVSFKSTEVYEAELRLTLFKREEAAEGVGADNNPNTQVFTGEVRTGPGGASILWKGVNIDAFDQWCSEPHVLPRKLHIFVGEYASAAFVLKRLREVSRDQESRYD
jgi:hypothetical protein